MTHQLCSVHFWRWQRSYLKMKLGLTNLSDRYLAHGEIPNRSSLLVWNSIATLMKEASSYIDFLRLRSLSTKVIFTSSRSIPFCLFIIFVTSANHSIYLRCPSSRLSKGVLLTSEIAFCCWFIHFLIWFPSNHDGI